MTLLKRPIIIFETELGPYTPNALLNILPYLEDYKCFGLEFSPEHNLSSALEACQIVLKNPTQSSHHTAFKENYQLKRRLLLEIRKKNLAFAGVNISEDRQDFYRATKVDDKMINQMVREQNTMIAKRIMELTETHHGKIVFVLNSEHIGALQIIKNYNRETFATLMSFFIHSPP